MKSKKYRTKKGGRNPTEGPYDTAVHRFMSKDDIGRHVKYMQSQKNIFEQEEAKEIKKIEDKRAEIEAEKERKFQASEAKRKEELQETMQAKALEQNIDKETAKNLGTIFQKSSAFGGNIIIWIFLFLEKIISGLFKGLSGVTKILGFGIDKLGSATGVLFNAIMQNIVYNLFKYLFSLIFALLFFAIVVVLIIYGASLFTTKSSSSSNSTSGDQKQCSSLLSDTITMNMTDFSKYFSGDSVTDSLNKSGVMSYIPDIPKYDFLPDTTFSWSNPWGTASSTVQNRTFVSTYKSFATGLKAARRLVSDLTGNNSEVLVERDELPEGRCDNEALVDAKLIKDQKLLTDHNIQINNPDNIAINIIKPHDIEWKLEEDEFVGKDYDLIPDDMKKLKLSDNYTIQDKNTIIIPWEQRDNQYKLYCRKAYYKNAGKENLAKILQDDIGTNTCTIDNSSKARAYTEGKTRYVGSKNLDSYLP
jgi:hypothetical protein